MTGGVQVPATCRGGGIAGDPSPVCTIAFKWAAIHGNVVQFNDRGAMYGALHDPAHLSMCDFRAIVINDCTPQSARHRPFPAAESLPQAFQVSKQSREARNTGDVRGVISNGSDCFCS